MIRINLLPPELEAAPSQINPAIPLAVAALLPAIVIAPMHFSQMATQKRLKNEATSLKNELERYQPIIAQVEALESAKAQLTQRKSVIQQLENERLRYPQFMDDFVKLLPGNLWLTNLTTTSKDNNVLVVNMDVMALDNYAIADLISNFETSQIFSDVELGAISASQSQLGYQTMSFHITTNYRKATLVSDATKKS
jgi:Tfp pilus assembly protein PilN